MPHLLIVRGLPGSGKTTLAKTLTGRVHFEADQWMHNREGNYEFDPNRLTECHNACITAAREALASGSDVVVSNTFSRRWEILPYINLGYPYSIVTCEGHHQNVHGVPRDKIAAMAERWEWF